MRKLLTFFILFLFFGCKKEDIEKNQPSEVNVSFSDKTVVVEKGLEELVVAVNENTQQYTFKKEGFKEQPKTGEVILIPGELMRKVKSVRSSGNNYIVETEDALVTEVIENGTIAFDITPQWGDATSLRIDGREMLKKGQRISVSPIEHQISVGGVDHKIIIEPKMVDGKINACSFKLQMSKGNSTAFEAVGTATLPTQQTKMVIENGKLKDFNSNNKGLKADFSVKMATAGGRSGEHSLALPQMAISIPIRYIPSPLGPIPNPIPMTIDVGVQFVSKMTIADPMSSARGESKVSFDADAGFHFQGSDVIASGDLNRSEIPEGTFDSAANIGLPIDLQFGIAFPRVSLNIAKQEVAFVHVGYTTGSRLKWGPLCKSGYSKIVVEGGYELKVFGQTISAAKKTFKEMEKVAGANCD
jgi:hypothetical protein